MIKVCVMGYPVFHSLSPRLHRFWLKKYNIDGDYTLNETRPEQLETSLAALTDQGYVGCNLTLPLKEYALPMMHKLDDSARAAGAVNTVVISYGKMIGYNSDGFGFVESLKEQHPSWDGTKTVIIGAGGAARGVIAALKQSGARNFVILNRTREKAEQLVCDLGLANATVENWENRACSLEHATLLINCSSLGMEKQPPLELDLSILPRVATVCDIVYRPLITPLLSAAKKRGNTVVEGLPMLLHQGRLGFRHWFGVDPAVTAELYEEIRRAIK